MGGFRSSKTAVLIAAASVLAYQTTGAQAASQHLRHRNLESVDDDNLESVDDDNFESADDNRTNDYQYLGCFKDNKKDRILGAKMTNDTHVQADFCYDYCVDLGAPLMATQWGIECWCATEVEVDFGRHGKGDKGEESVCNFPCAGDKNEMCGGFDAFDLYMIVSDMRDDDDGADEPSSPTPEEPTPSPVTPPTPSPVTPPTSSPVTPPTRSPVTPPTPSPVSPPAPRLPERKEAPDGALVDDIVKIISVKGRTPGGEGWADSYSVGDKCFMYTNFDHDVGDITVDTPKGEMTIRELYDQLEAGPGPKDRPLYNDIQCGNGPPNTAADETDCPGLVEYGEEGCGQIGPMWDLSEL